MVGEGIRKNALELYKMCEGDGVGKGGWGDVACDGRE